MSSDNISFLLKKVNTYFEKRAQGSHNYSSNATHVRLVQI